MATRQFVDDFSLVIATLMQKYPEQWPEETFQELLEEAKAAARGDMENAEVYYEYTAACIRDHGELT